MSSHLNQKQEKFCKLYSTTLEYFGNGVKSYAEAYGLDLAQRGSYMTAKSNAHKLLTNTDILKRIDELLDDQKLSENYVDKQLDFLIAQSQELAVKLRAIQEYNKLKNRYKQAESNPKSINVNISNYQDKIDDASQEELLKMAIDQVESEMIK